MKKIIKYFFVFLFLFLIGGYFYIQHIKKSALPDYNAHIQIEGLKDEVKVYRDNYGVPHVYATNEADLYKVVGYISAQDRLWQMDLLRRVTQGRLSELFGEKTVNTDVFLRKLQIPENSKKLLATLDEKTRKPLDYFSQGVNLYLKDHKDNLPFEFKLLGYKPEAWKPEHSLNLVGYMAWNLELGYKMEVILHILRTKISEEKFRLLLPDYKRNKTYVYPSFKIPEKVEIDSSLVAAIDLIPNFGPDIFNGSNNWVVAGKKSQSGKPLFSNDMHLHLNVPGIWNRMHQVVKGGLDVTGVTLPGSPFIVAGHNQNIAWGMTNVMLDGADFYTETISKDKKKYKLNGEWKNLRIKKEKIYVKGKEKPLIKTLYFTHRGPVITQFGELSTQPVSMHWVGNEESREIEALYKFNRAKNWKDFKEASKGFNSVSQNIAYADIQGNIGIQMSGKVPKRIAPGYMFFPGDTDKYDWKGFIPADSLPFEYNPDRGFVSSANNKTISDKKFPYYITEWYDLPYRINRIRQMLTEKEKLSPEDFRKMLFDHLSLQAVELKPIIINELQQTDKLNRNEKAVLESLMKWDNRYEKNSSQALVFDQFLILFIKNIAKDEMGDNVFKAFNGSLLFSKYLLQNVILTQNDEWCDNVTTKEKETFHDMVVKSYKETLDLISKKYGSPLQAKWGDNHKLLLEHPLGKVKTIDWVFHLNRKYKAPGNANTVNPFTYNFNQPFTADMGASQKHIFNTADWDQSYSILPTGVSGIPASKHYLDQSKKYIEGKLLPDVFGLKKVKEKSIYTTIFTRKK